MKIKTLFQNKLNSFEFFAQWFIRLMILAVVVVYFVSLEFLPVENDELFEVNLLKKYDTEITEDDVIYKGQFSHIIDNNNEELITLPAKIRADKSQKISIQSVIPDDYDEDYLIIRSSQQDITIYIDGKSRVIYNTAASRPVGSQTTSRFVLCRTSREDAGKKLRITISSDCAEYAGTINKVYACDKFTFWKYMFRESASNVILGVVSMAIGLFVVIIGLCLSRVMKYRIGLENAGWCVLLVGVWLTCESKIRQLLTPNASALSNVCFIVIMLGGIPLVLYLNDLQRFRYKSIYRVLISAMVINTVCQMVLQQLNVFDYIDMLLASHILLFISVFTSLILIIADIGNKNHLEYRGMCVGILVLMFCVVVELVSVYFVTMMSGVFVLIGIIVFTIFAIFDAISRYRERERQIQEQKLKEQQEHSDAMTLQMIKTLSDTLEAKDEYTKGHSFRVAEYSVLIARKLGLSDEEIASLHYAASLHDIGKIGVPDTILNKPSRLTNEEYSVIKTHTTKGADIIKGIDLISYAEEVARYHHERFDGKGYPNGVSGEDIPLFARIVAVADSYDAMSSKRIYRNGLSKEEIRNEIQKNLGLQFDPVIGQAFIDMLDEGELEKVEQTGDAYSLKDFDNENISEATQMFSAVMRTIKSSAEDGSYDFLTGLMLRSKGENAILNRMLASSGALMFIDVDNLKTINDLYGHKVGDEALKILGDLLKNAPENAICCRMGGDEFVVYYEGAVKEVASAFANIIIEEYSKKQSVNSKLSTSSLSIGIHMTVAGEKFEEAVNKADKALYYVKKSGKNSYAFYTDEAKAESSSNNQIDLRNLIQSIRTSGTYSGSLKIEYREFTKLYEYIVKVCKRYEHTCHLVLVTIETGSENVSIEDIEQAMEGMGIAIKENIRNVDVCTRYSSVQYLIILLEAGDANIDVVMGRVFERYYKICKNTNCIPSYQTKSMKDEL